MSFLSTISQWLVRTLEPYGAPGLMLIAICDSSFLSLPEVNDVALMALSINNPANMWRLATMTVLGSIIGCSLLYSIGRKGGEALLEKRFAPAKVSRVRAWYQKYGMLAVIVPSLLPPPLPFKIFVLSAGAFKISWPRFITAVAIGRSIRYFSEGILAVLYGRQAIQIVSDNFPFVGFVLAVLIVAGAFIYVYSRRRRVNAGAILLPLLLLLLGSGCVKTVPQSQRMLPAFPFSRQQALDKLKNISSMVISVGTNIRLSGSTASLKEANKRYTTPIALNGTLFMARPHRIYLVGSLPLHRVFEMVSDGKNYQVYNNQREELYVNGVEEGPPAKPIPHLGDLANQFVGMKPRRLHEALMINVLQELEDPSILTPAYPVVLDRKTYYVVDFVETDSEVERLMLKIWFDLSTENVDIVRRQTYTADSELETDTQYSGYESLSASLRYPSRFDIQLHDTDTMIQIDLNPMQAQFNTEIPQERFKFDTHPDAKIFQFEPRDANTVSLQR